MAKKLGKVKSYVKVKRVMRGIWATKTKVPGWIWPRYHFFTSRVEAQHDKIQILAWIAEGCPKNGLQETFLV